MFKHQFNVLFAIGKKSIGVLLFILCAIAIYNSALKNENWAQLVVLFKQQLVAIAFYKWVVLFILLAINFFIESVKWKLVLADTQPVGILQAIKTVLVGQAFAFFTPNRIGDFAGRALFLPSEHKLMGMAHLAWSSYAQLIVTIIIGTIGLSIQLPLYPWIEEGWLTILKWIFPLVGMMALALFFFHKKWEGRLRFLNVIQIDTKVKIQLLLFSFLRYLVFLWQYVWVTNMLNIDIDTTSLMLSVSILFLCLSILPTINFTELVVRGQLLLLILAPIYVNKHMIIFLVSFIWGVNFLLPSIIGSFLLLGYRLNR